MVLFLPLLCARLARQWTMEDEEEVEREKRRRVRGSSSTADPEDDFKASPTDAPVGGEPFGGVSTPAPPSIQEGSQGLNR